MVLDKCEEQATDISELNRECHFVAAVFIAYKTAPHFTDKITVRGPFSFLLRCYSNNNNNNDENNNEINEPYDWRSIPGGSMSFVFISASYTSLELGRRETKAGRPFLSTLS
jgi:hypothetical protein